MNPPMAETHADVVARLLAQVGLANVAEKVGDGMYKIKWGSATLITGAAGNGIVAIAPMFAQPPGAKREEFYRRLLEINATIGGTAAFALHKDGTVALQLGRGIDGLDANEFALMLGAGGQLADPYHDNLKSEIKA
jgi:hypothetical protein